MMTSKHMSAFLDFPSFSSPTSKIVVYGLGSGLARAGVMVDEVVIQLVDVR